jgi:hypothetical protein
VRRERSPAPVREMELLLPARMFSLSSQAPSERPLLRSMLCWPQNSWKMTAG